MLQFLVLFLAGNAEIEDGNIIVEILDHFFLRMYIYLNFVQLHHEYAGNIDDCYKNLASISNSIVK